MRAGNLEVIYLDGDDGEDIFHERGAVAATFAVRELDTHEELSSGHRSNGNVIVVPDHVVETEPFPFGGDEDRGIEDQSLQRRSSTLRPARSSRSSFAHFGSRGFALRAALRAA
jgi:hypothetical protein